MSTAYIGSPCETENFVTVTTPWGIKVVVNKAVEKRFRLACKRAKRFARFTPQRIDSYACRKIRGSTSWSRHSYGCAWDIFITGPMVPPPGGVWHPTETFGENFAECFTDLGFTWGSKWQRQDWPHMEWSSPIVPALTGAERLQTFRAAQRRAKEAKPKR